MVLVQDALDQIVIVAVVNIAQTSQSLGDWEKRNSTANSKHKKCQSLTTPERISTSTGIQSEVHNEACASIATIDKFLLNHDRKIHNIKGDGNCLFRSCSHAFLNHEDHHFTLRNHIVRTINLNPTVFSNYLMPINKPTIEEHVKPVFGELTLN